jgi:ssDNA-binding Zn-finger/Zn-ribbon topoisomerase 1
LPYVRCPVCGLLAHAAPSATESIHCPRCRSRERDVELSPLEESLRNIGDTPEPRPATDP